MIRRRFTFFTGAVLLSGAFYALGAGTAAGRSDNDLQRTVSANEKMILRFRSEIQAVADPKKRAVLENKIKDLEKRNENLLKILPAASAAPVRKPEVKSLEDLQGGDWARLSEAEKQRFIYTAIGGLERRGVFVMNSPDTYRQAMDKILESDGDFKEEYLENLFMFCVYDAEPQTRDAIELMRRELIQEA